MKILADRFQVTMTGLKGDRSDRENLRMLAKPLYRAEPGKVQSPTLIGSTAACLASSRGRTRRPSSCWKRFARTAPALAVCLRPIHRRRPQGAAG